ncbi:MAG: endolytic transglycosylase MltG [Oscillospiraceae bacterium]|nr:endolytic transglycosylase MltG [Oscillospiraceae bacterium]
MQDKNDRDDLFEEMVDDEYSFLINEIKNSPEGVPPEIAEPREELASPPVDIDSIAQGSKLDFDDILSDITERDRQQRQAQQERQAAKKAAQAPAHPAPVKEKEQQPVPDEDELELRRAEKKPRMEHGPDEDAEDERYPIHRGGTKRLGCVPGVLYMLLVICLGIGLGAAAWLAASDVLAFGKDDSPIEITIPESVMYEAQQEVQGDDGETYTETVTKADIDEVATILKDNEVIKYPKLFKQFCKISHADGKIEAGTYIIHTNYDYHAIVSGLHSGSGIKAETDVTIPEGYTLAQIFTLLDQEGVCSADKLEDAAANYDFDYDFLDESTLGQAKRLEGYLFPDTYTFYIGDDPENVIARFLSNFNNKFTEEYRQAVQNLGYSVHDIITIASMIEKEAGGDAERATIASVIYNRLNDSYDYPYLNIDATINYVIAETGESFSTDIDSPYNTYTNIGLPPGPISNPGIASIRAALYPEDTSYYYYALGLDHMHRFFYYYDDFLDFTSSEEYGG